MTALAVEQKIIEGHRLTADEAIDLYQQTPLARLGQLASIVRFRFNPQPRVTFVIDTNPNYTNICVTHCLFCAFYRNAADEDAYTLDVEAVMAKIDAAVQAGATTILLQGGHNPAIPLETYFDMVRETRTRYPDVTPHFYSASEIRFIADTWGLSVRRVLERLRDAGQFTLPGGGAEVLADRVRKRIAARKGSSDEWIDVHRTAHQLGFRSTATLMFGHVETLEDILEHLDHIRSLQDETHGFTAFIPWSFKPNHTYLGRTIPNRASGTTYLRMIALARVFLDNVEHIQATWFSESPEIGQLALHFGADDFGGTLIEENVHKATGHVRHTTTDEIIDRIRLAGFIPAQRTTLYTILKTFPAVA